MGLRGAETVVIIDVGKKGGPVGGLSRMEDARKKSVGREHKEKHEDKIQTRALEMLFSM
jgi:hypothetical protein